MRLKNHFLFAIAGILCFFIIGSCKHEITIFPPDVTTSVGDSTTTCDPSNIYFQQQVLPILVSNCAQSGCHDNNSHREGVILTSYNSTMSTGGVRPGNPSNSKLYRIISNNEMPPKGYTDLTQSQKDIIYNWILQGAENLVCENICGDTVNVTYSLSIKPIIANKCQGCHSGTSPQGGIDLSTYTGVQTQTNNGKLWGSVNWSAGFVTMPQGGAKLSTCELTQIHKWITMGAPNN